MRATESVSPIRKTVAHDIPPRKHFWGLSTPAMTHSTFAFPHKVFTSAYLGCFQVLRLTKWRLIYYLPNCTVIIVFLGRERDNVLPSGQIHPSQPPAYLAHTSTASLCLYYNTSRVPNHYRLQSSRIIKPPNGTVPLDSSNSEVM